MVSVHEGCYFFVFLHRLIYVMCLKCPPSAHMSVLNPERRHSGIGPGCFEKRPLNTLSARRKPSWSRDLRSRRKNVKPWRRICSEPTNVSRRSTVRRQPLPRGSVTDLCYVSYPLTTAAATAAAAAMPCAGSGVVRIDPLRFLAECRKRRLTRLCLSWLLA